MSSITRGRFVTFEGVEGSGKSSNVEQSAQFLEECGIDVLVTHEPGRTKLGDEIRNVVLKQREEKVSDLAELFLMFASRSQLIHDVIRPALESGRWVLCDRYADSSIAYQGGGREIGVPEVELLIEAMGENYLQPDLTILLDLEPSLIDDRLNHRNLDRIESENVSFFDRVRKTYLALADRHRDRMRVVDASMPVEDVQREVRRLFNPLLSAYQSK